jgi:hypothetical protein
MVNKGKPLTQLYSRWLSRKLEDNIKMNLRDTGLKTEEK